MIVLSVVGLVGGYSLAGMAHESEWFMTKAEFVERHGKSDAGWVAFGNFVSAGLAGAVILPVGGLIVFSLLPGRSVRAAPLFGRMENAPEHPVLSLDRAGM